MGMSMKTLVHIRAVETRPPIGSQRGASSAASSWIGVYRMAGVAAFAVVALVPIQALLFIVWPPPTRVVDYFSTFQQNVLLGLVDLDLLLIVDQLLMVVVLLGLYAALRQTDPSLMLVGVTVGLIGASLFIVSREATVSMLLLSQQYAVATSDAERATLIAAGQTLLTTYNGTAFAVGYFLSGLAMLLVSAVMLRGKVFRHLTGLAGLLAGVTGLVPASFGTVGLVLSFISLLPLVVWLALIGQRFVRLGFPRRITHEPVWALGTLMLKACTEAATGMPPRDATRAHTGPLPVRHDLRVVVGTSLVTAPLLTITAVAGLLFGTRGLYTSDPATLPAFLGQDGITLVAILPLLLWSVRTACRGSLRGLLLWTAALFYVAYSYAYYVLNPEFNVLYLAYIAIVGMSLYGCLYLLLVTDLEFVAAQFSHRTPVRLAGGFLMALSLGLGLAWVAAIISHLASGSMPGRVNQVVWPMDLIVAFPAMFWGGLWLWRRQPLGYALATVLLIKGGLLGITLVVNTWLATTFWGVAPDPVMPVYAIGGLGGLALATQYLRTMRNTHPVSTALAHGVPVEAAASGAS
jgi:hypothetical protein